MHVEQRVVCPVIIGRSAPLSAVLHTLERARATHGSTLLVSGEAGIGKSRLVQAMREQARTFGFVTLQGASFEADRAQPYAPLLDLVRVLVATTSPALAAHYFAPVGTELVTLFPELRPIFPDATPREVFDPEEDRRRLFHAFTVALQALAKVQPLLLVIEDVHWSDDATLDLVLHLARQIGTHGIALILTFRSDEIGLRLARLLADLDRGRCASEVALRPLAALDVSAMLQAIFGGEVAADAHFVDSLHALTEGNPFFVEEVLKALVVGGDLTNVNGAWRARPLADVRVPRTAKEAVGRRLAGLSDAARRVASVAAVAGRRFDFGLLQSLTQHSEEHLLSLVKELVDAQLVVEESADRFAFRHALTRETIRSQLLARERIALHRAIARALENEDDGTTRDAAEALAYHAFEAGVWESARRYALRAAAHAQALCAPRESLQQLERAVTATERGGGVVDASLLIARGRAYETLGAFAQASDDFTAALAAARATGDKRGEWEAMHALGMLWAARDYERAGGYRRDALEVARSIDDPSLVAHSLNRVGNWYVNREDPHAGIPYHDEALAIFEHLNDRRGIAETVDLLGMSHHIAGNQEEAVQLEERAISIFSALENRRGMANALSLLIVCGPSHHASAWRIHTSEHSNELLVGERGVRLASEIGWRAGEAFARYLLADALGWRGEYVRALRFARESLAIAQDIEHLEWQCGARRTLGVMALDCCAIDEALLQLDRAHTIAQQLGSATWIRWTAAPFAIALARAGKSVEGKRVLDTIDQRITPYVDSGVTEDRRSDEERATLGTRFLAIARAEVALATGDAEGALQAISHHPASGVPRATLLRGLALTSLGRWEDALESLGSARNDATEQGARPLLWRIECAIGHAWLGRRRRLDARRAFDSARTIAASLMESLDDATLAGALGTGIDRLAPPPPAPTPGREAKATHGGLTRRERDTAALIARGQSNRAIARALGIGERTVEGYVAASLAKLGFSSRAQLAVWAAEQGLARPEVPPSLQRP